MLCREDTRAPAFTPVIDREIEWKPWPDELESKMTVICC